MKAMFNTLIISIIASFSWAQTPENTVNDLPYIEVNGYAEKKVIPDEIYISITIKERQDGKDKTTIEEQESALKEGLAKMGIPLSNLMLSNANADYIKVKWSKKDVIARNQYLLKVGSAEIVGKVFNYLDEIKIQDAYISHVDHSEIIKLQKEVRIMAIKAAKKKADYLLEAIGEETGKAMIVREANTNVYRDDTYLNARNSAEIVTYSVSGQESQKKMEIEFRKIELQSRIYVKFSIK
ncbi:MAG TPA: hypothetical protein DDX92_10205 [Flavobacteriales bacterium]|jgi:uncharacterized protein YggE|nr:hypothetical protein [Flavobacteriales bacterium]